MNNRFLATFYPESRFGGYSDIDGTVVFYQRVNCLLSRDSRVLDFGCGWGDYRNDPVPLRRELRVFKGKVKKVIGVDVDPRGATNPFLDEFRLLEDQAPWPVESQSIDLVLSDNVLEHIQNPDWFFGESARVLVEGGLARGGAAGGAIRPRRVFPDRLSLQHALFAPPGAGAARL